MTQTLVKCQLSRFKKGVKRVPTPSANPKVVINYDPVTDLHGDDQEDHIEGNNEVPEG